MKYLILALLLSSCATKKTVLKVAETQLNLATVTERGFRKVFDDIERIDVRLNRLSSNQVQIESIIKKSIESIEERLEKLEAQKVKGVKK